MKIFFCLPIVLANSRIKRHHHPGENPPPAYRCKFSGPADWIAWLQEQSWIRPECEYEDNGHPRGGPCVVENGQYTNYQGMAWYGYQCDVYSALELKGFTLFEMNVTTP